MIFPFEVVSFFNCELVAKKYLQINDENTRQAAYDKTKGAWKNSTLALLYSSTVIRPWLSVITGDFYVCSEIQKFPTVMAMAINYDL